MKLFSIFLSCLESLSKAFKVCHSFHSSVFQSNRSDEFLSKLSITMELHQLIECYNANNTTCNENMHTYIRNKIYNLRTIFVLKDL